MVGALSGTELLSSSISRVVCLPKLELVQQRQGRLKVKQRSAGVRASAELLEPVTSAATPDLTWQITAGAIDVQEEILVYTLNYGALNKFNRLTKHVWHEWDAGVTPFVVAGIEFSKRIMQQRRCQVCGGSGLVKRVGIVVRCNGCGGFLPWQSWRRFFSGK